MFVSRFATKQLEFERALLNVILRRAILDRTNNELFLFAAIVLITLGTLTIEPLFAYKQASDVAYYWIEIVSWHTRVK